MHCRPPGCPSRSSYQWPSRTAVCSHQGVASYTRQKASQSPSGTGRTLQKAAGQPHQFCHPWALLQAQLRRSIGSSSPQQ
eukprot:2750561-Amphidinium_carterae.2